ncbi:MAG TPA: SCO family protein [Vicinamibacterales bacterium]
MRFFSTTAAALLMATAMAAPAAAQRFPEPGGQPTSAKPGILAKIGIDQRLNEQVPLDLPFVDENGKNVRLGDYFGKRPVILAMVYYECPMLCTQVLNGMVSALGVMKFNAGQEFDVIAVSINPKEGPGLASQKKQAYVERYKRPGTEHGFHFLTGSQESITKLAQAVGFRYEYDAETGQYAHGAGIEVLTPKGVISRYFYGIEFAPRDIQFGLMDASEQRIGSRIDDALLLCYHYDPSTGKYGVIAIDAIRIGGVATVLAFFTFLFVSLRRERASKQAH